MRKSWLTAAVWAAASVAFGCNSVGDGTGSATGDLFMLGCNDDGSDFGSQASPQPFDLAPSYFVGEPIEDPFTPPSNRLIIRMQRNGNAPEITDTLYFDIPKSREVARCLRGRIDPNTGLPDWDTGTGTVDTTVTQPWCQPSATAGVPPTIHLVPSGPVRSSFTPFGKCVSQQHAPAIVSLTAVAKDGTITFADFGGAEQNNLPPDQRNAVEQDFKVNFGDRLNATFNLILDDDRTETAIKLMVDVPPPPNIGGTLAGNFDFDLARGQGAQTFP